MSTCRFCGKEFDDDQFHMIYAFVGKGIYEAETLNLCPIHTNRMSELLRSERMDLDSQHAVRCGVRDGEIWFGVDGIGATRIPVEKALEIICRILGEISDAGHPLEITAACGRKATISVEVEE